MKFEAIHLRNDRTEHCANRERRAMFDISEKNWHRNLPDSQIPGGHVPALFSKKRPQISENKENTI